MTRMELSEFDLIEAPLTPQREPESVQEEVGSEVEMGQFDLRPSTSAPEELSSIPYAGPAARGLVGGRLGLPGDIYGLIEAGTDWIFDNSFGRLMYGSPEESARVNKEMKGMLSGRFGEERKRFPGITEFKGYIDSLTGGALQPGTRGERIVGAGAEFLGGASLPAGVAKGALKAPAMVGAFAGGAATQEAEEQGVGPLGQLGIGLGTSILTQAGATKFGNAIQQVKDIGFKNLIREPGRLGAHVPGLKVKPTSEISEIAKIAQQEGITLPLSAVTDSSVTRVVENAISKAAYGRQAYKDLFSKTNKEFVDSYKSMLDRISIVDFGEKFEAGVTGQQALKAARDTAQEKVRALYTQSRENLPRGATVADNGIRDVSKKMSKDISQSLLPSTEEAATRGEFQELLKNLEGVEVKPSALLGADGNTIKLAEGSIPVERLVATERSLNDLINYEKQGGSKKLLIQANKKVGEALEKYSEQSPEAAAWYKDHKKAKEGFADLAQRFRNNLIDNSLRNEKPEFILNHMGTKSGIQTVGKALADSPEGREVFDSLKRYKLQDLIGKKVINASTGEVRYQAAASAMADPKQQEILKELMGTKNYQLFTNLQKVSSGIEKGFREFINPSKTADVNFARMSGYAPLAGIISGMAAQNPSFVVGSVGTLAAPYVMSKLMTNENFLKEASRLAIAGNKGKKNDFARALKQLMPMIQDVLSEVSDVVKFEGEDAANEQMSQFDLSSP